MPKVEMSRWKLMHLCGITFVVESPGLLISANKSWGQCSHPILLEVSSILHQMAAEYG